MAMTLTTSSTFDAEKWTRFNAKLDASPITHLFNRLEGAYPGRWKQSFPSEQSVKNWKSTWTEALVEEGITPLEVKIGLANCRRMYDWPPSITEFIKACRPGLDPETAFHEAVQGLSARRRGEMGNWSHPAVYHATVDVGQHDILNCSYQVMRGRWERALNAQLSRGEWPPVPSASVALTAPKKTEQTNEQAAQSLEALGATDLVNRPRRDHRAWAARILSNAKRRSPGVVAMAQRALQEGVPA